MKPYTIYEIENSVNGKKYIGKAKDFENRKMAHLANAKNSKRGGPLYSAMRKYGIELFKFSVLEIVIDDDPNEAEKHWIRVVNSLTPNGYNIAKGGTGGDLLSAHPRKKEIYANRRKSNTRNKDRRSLHDKMISRYGKIEGEKRFNDLKLKISKANSGRKRTPEQKKRISESLINRTLSETHCKNIGKARLRK